MEKKSHFTPYNQGLKLIIIRQINLKYYKTKKKIFCQMCFLLVFKGSQLNRKNSGRGTNGDDEKRQQNTTRKSETSVTQKGTVKSSKTKTNKY
jgi:hypothetical protein